MNKLKVLYLYAITGKFLLKFQKIKLTHNNNFFLLNAEGTNLYASFLSIFVMYLVAIRSLQLGQNIAP